MEYQVYGTDKLENSTLNEKLVDSMSKQPDIKLTVGKNTLTGVIDPTSQFIKGNIFFHILSKG